MKEEQRDSVQIRFTAYLVSAVTNRRIRHMEHKKQVYNWELMQMDMFNKNNTNFEVQFNTYLSEKLIWVAKESEKIQELFLMIESEELTKALRKLKERECKLLFSRVFGELTFEELGEKFDMKPKQAEMAFYYILRKVRKEMEVSEKDEF